MEYRRCKKSPVLLLLFSSALCKVSAVAVLSFFVNFRRDIMPHMRKVPVLVRVFIILIILTGLAAAAYSLPPVHERLAWRVDSFISSIKYRLNPPEQVVFVPQQTQSPLDRMVTATLQALTASAPAITSTPTPTPVTGEATLVINSPTPVTPTPTPTPLPALVDLQGITQEFQKWNNCGPATLAMALTYWGWEGDQRTTAPFLKPNDRDKNVMPYEMADYVTSQAGLSAIVRSGGDQDTLRRLLAAGFPIVVEKGLYISSEGWMGHYQVLSGYDDAKARFTAQDSYTGPGKNVRVPYADMENFWQDFNNVFLVIYPSDREDEVVALLGPLADEVSAFTIAAAQASEQITLLSGRDLFFAWYNRGTSLAALQDYAGAAAAYDQAFSVYAGLGEKERPWRNIWYQTGPYFAYYYTGRYYDVIDLATKTLQFLSSEPTLEESWVWRARAKAALGDTAGAISDLRRSLEYHPNFAPSLQELQLLGASVE